MLKQLFFITFALDVSFLFPWALTLDKVWHFRVLYDNKKGAGQFSVDYTKPTEDNMPC